MKFTVASLLLAASTAFAAPTTTKRNGTLTITDFWANTSGALQDSTMHFMLSSSNYPDEGTTECNLIWQENGTPKLGAMCNNGKYHIEFPSTACPDTSCPVNVERFTLKLVRVDGSPIPEVGERLLSSGAFWNCVHQDSGDVTRCTFPGTLTIPV